MMTQPIRVVVANQPRLMRELVLETILEQPDIEIVAEIQNEERNVSIFFWASFDIHSSQVEASQAGILSTLRRKSQYVGG